MLFDEGQDAVISICLESGPRISLAKSAQQGLSVSAVNDLCQVMWPSGGSPWTLTVPSKGAWKSQPI